MGGLLLIVSALSLGVAIGMVSWSIWWPHSDMRQIWASFLILIGAVVGLATLRAGLARLDESAQILRAMAAIVVAVAVVIASLVFDVALEETLPHR